jgi:polyisoprenoid-binding protein YceI
MKVSATKSISASAAAVLALALLLSAAPGPPRHQETSASRSELVLTLDPAQSKVHFNVESTLHTVHGTFSVKSGIVHFDPQTGKAGGEIVVNATSGDSGSNSRDARMHKEILETTKYPEAVFHPSQVEGQVASIGASDVKLRGTISLHGADHELTALIHANLASDHWTGTAKFEVPYISWGIKDPSNFFLKVKPVVNVELEMSGALNSAK